MALVEEEDTDPCTSTLTLAEEEVIRGGKVIPLDPHVIDLFTTDDYGHVNVGSHFDLQFLDFPWQCATHGRVRKIIHIGANDGKTKRYKQELAKRQKLHQRR